MMLPRRVHVSGPMEPYAAGFGAELERLGYSPWSVVFALQSLAGLSRWLVARDLRPADLSSAELERFVRERRASGPRRRTTPRGLPVLVRHLRGLGVIPVATRVVADDRLARLLDEFAAFLIEERGLARGTVWYYQHHRATVPATVGGRGRRGTAAGERVDGAVVRDRRVSLSQCGIGEEHGDRRAGAVAVSACA